MKLTALIILALGVAFGVTWFLMVFGVVPATEDEIFQTFARSSIDILLGTVLIIQARFRELETRVDGLAKRKAPKAEVFGGYCNICGGTLYKST